MRDTMYKTKKTTKEKFSRATYPKASLKFLANVKNLANKLAEKFPEKTTRRYSDGNFERWFYIVYSESVRGIFISGDDFINVNTYDMKRRYNFVPPEQDGVIHVLSELTGKNSFQILWDGSIKKYKYFVNTKICFENTSSIFRLAYAMTMFPQYRWKLINVKDLDKDIVKFREKLKIPVDKDGNVVKV
jgi:hypothetical protein